MKRIDTSTRAIDLFGAGKDGFKDGNLALGVAPTDFNASWPNMIQEEIANVIEGMGTALNPGDRTQLSNALKGRLIAVRVISTSGTYTPTTGTRAIRVTVQGAGGGGGAAAGTGAGQLSTGTGGNSGATAQSFLTAGFSGASMVVGVGGGGGNGGNGGTGGTSSFGAISAPGGAGGNLGGAVSPPFINPPATNSLVASGGNVYNLSTGTGQPGFPISASSAFSGTGASTIFGQGPAGRNAGGGGGTATNFGCGGAGGLAGSGSGAQLGGNGANGAILIEEFA